MAGMDVAEFLLLRHPAELPMELADGFTPLLGQSHKGHVPHVGHGPVDPLWPQYRDADGWHTLPPLPSVPDIRQCPDMWRSM